MRTTIFALAALVLPAALCPGPGRAAPPRLEWSFDAAEEGQFPSGWKSRDEGARAVYRVRAAAAAHLAAESAGDSHTIASEADVDPAEYPWLRFSWRARRLPEGGDERHRATNDSVLGVYVIFKGFGYPPRSIKYVWSTTLPAGTTTSSPFSDRSRMIVLRSGAERLGEWIEEEVDIRDDFIRLFGGRKVPGVKGIAVLTDSDNTGTQAAGDYGSIRFGAADRPRGK